MHVTNVLKDMVKISDNEILGPVLLSKVIISGQKGLKLDLGDVLQGLNLDLGGGQQGY